LPLRTRAGSDLDPDFHCATPTTLPRPGPFPKRSRMCARGQGEGNPLATVQFARDRPQGRWMPDSTRDGVNMEYSARELNSGPRNPPQNPPLAL
jgi:hypothetical protein